MTLACVFGCAGPVLLAEEAAFFGDVRPWGFILFRRNVESPAQVRALTAALRRSVGRPDAPVMIDQEGGRVQRLVPPHWRSRPAARSLAVLPYGLDERRDLVRLAYRLIAHDLSGVGVNVDCAPVADVPAPGSHDIVGDRAFGERADQVAVLARAAADGLIAGGVLPVVKHMPGHGRATADSHESLPRVEAGLDELERADFAPFRTLSDLPMAMTAHVVYAALDPRRPATTSRKVIGGVIRGSIGFSGLLVSDDLSMKALSGDLGGRARAALAAGCDIALHCNGDLSEMASVAAAARELSGPSRARAAAALARIPRQAEPFDAAAAEARLAAALADGGRA